MLLIVVMVLMMMVVVLMVMIVTAAAMTVFMVMVMLVLQLCQIGSHAGLAIHRLSQLCAGELIPRSGHDGGILVLFPEHFHCLIQFLLGNGVCTGQNDGGSSFHLVVIELTKVLGVHLHLACVHNGYGIAQGHFFVCDLIHCSDHIGQLAHTGGFDDDPLRSIIRNHLVQRFAEIAHQAAADTAGVHLGNIDAGILQKAAVNTDLTEFIFDQHQFLAAIVLLDHFFDQCCFAGT